MRKTTLSIFLTALLAMWTAAASHGAGIVNLSISGSKVTAEVSLPLYEADLTLEFENVVGLSLANLGVSAQTVSLTSLASRLPSLSTVGTTGFPVLLEIEPPSTGGLAFDGVYTLELHTHDLTFTAGCPLRLFKAEDGGDFRDVTTSMGTGSYRVRTHSAAFSEFLIVTDTRDVDDVVELKFDRLADLLDDHAADIPSAVHSALESDFDDARADWDAGDENAAIDHLDDFQAEVVDHDDSDIPNTWRSARDLDNVAGELRAAARTLQFSLALVP